MLPARTEVAVIGGGIAGCAVAYELGRRGIPALVLEADDFNGKASGANAGSLHAQIPMDPFVRHGRDWAEAFASTIRLMTAAIRRWRALEAELGCDLEVGLKGGLLVAGSEAQLRAMEQKVALERRFGLNSHFLGRNALRDLAPYISERMIGGTFCADEGKASPLRAGPAFAGAARRLGATLLPFTAVRAATREPDGYRLATDRGSVTARRLVIASGADAGRTAALFGLDLPLWGEPIQASVSEPVTESIPHLVYFAGEKLTLKQNAAGSLLIGGGWPARSGADGLPRLDGANLRRNLEVAAQVVPAVAQARLLRSWPATVNANADWKPVLGPVPGQPDLHLCCFPWMGFTAGPLCARLVAQAMTGEPSDLDITEFGIGRYQSAV